MLSGYVCHLVYGFGEFGWFGGGGSVGRMCCLIYGGNFVYV